MYDPFQSDIYAKHLSQLSKQNNNAIAQEDIHSAAGELLLSKGCPFEERFVEQITRHKLSKPLDLSVGLESSLTGMDIYDDTLSFSRDFPYMLVMHDLGDANRLMFEVCEKLNNFPLIMQQLTLMKAELNSTYNLSLAAAWIAINIASQMRFSLEDHFNVYLAALIQDIGYLHIEPYILEKSIDELTDIEKKIFYTHPMISKTIVEGIPGVEAVVIDSIAQHHEQWDGSGYPNHTTLDDLEVIGQIVLVSNYTIDYSVSWLLPHRKSLRELLPVLRSQYEDQFPSVYRALRDWIQTCLKKDSGANDPLYREKNCRATNSDAINQEQRQLADRVRYLFYWASNSQLIAETLSDAIDNPLALTVVLQAKEITREVNISTLLIPSLLKQLQQGFEEDNELPHFNRLDNVEIDAINEALEELEWRLNILTKNILAYASEIESTDVPRAQMIRLRIEKIEKLKSTIGIDNNNVHPIH